MTDEVKVLLFDVDGVLIDPVAYRTGVSKTVEILCQRCAIENWKELLPTEAELAHMESLGIHDVWDISDIIFGSILDSIACQLSDNDLLVQMNQSFVGADVGTRLDRIADLRLHVTKPEYVELGDTIMARKDASGELHPPDGARAVFAEKLRRYAIRNQPERLDDASQEAGATDEWLRLYDCFLIGTRSALESYGTKLFQNIILGEEIFEKTFALRSEYAGPSLLQADRALIDRANVKVLRWLNKQPGWHVCVYTARPSYPTPEAVAGYSPEAEIALQLAGMSDFPLVGMGAMEWLAAQYGERSEDLTKPNTTQAMAALIAALRSSCNKDVLKAAYASARQQSTDETIGALKSSKISIYVFEDTVSGIKPMLKVAEQLNAAGCSITVQPHGIAKSSQKRDALAEFCGQNLHEDVNQAVDAVLERYAISNVAPDL